MCYCSGRKSKCLVEEIYRVLQPGGRFITFSLHSIEEVEFMYSNKNDFNWMVSCCRVRSDRWNDTANRKRAVAHTMIVCDKPRLDGSYKHEYPLQIRGVLDEEEYQSLKAYADQVTILLHSLYNDHDINIIE